MFMLYALVAGLAIGMIRGGRPSALASIPFRGGPVALLGLACQIVLFSPPPTAPAGEPGPPISLAPTPLVVAVVARNIAVAPWLGLVVIGALANLAAIVANGGYMPTTPEALVAAARVEANGYSNSIQLARPALEALVDRFAMPAGLPFANVFSLGDVIVGIGIAGAIASGMAGVGAIDGETQSEAGPALPASRHR